MAFNPQTGNYESLEDTGYSAGQITSWLSQVSARHGASIESGHLNEISRKLMGESRYMKALGGDPSLVFAEFEEQYRMRGASTSHRTQDSQDYPDDYASDPRYEVGSTYVARPSVAAPLAGAAAALTSGGGNYDGRSMVSGGGSGFTSTGAPLTASGAVFSGGGALGEIPPWVLLAGGGVLVVLLFRGRRR